MAEAIRLAILTFFLSHGATPAQANALVHLAYDESRGQHCVISRDRKDHWLLQWRGPRRVGLARYAGTLGCPSLHTQLNWAMWELSSRPYNRFWYVGNNNAYPFLKRCFAAGRDCS